MRVLLDQGVNPRLHTYLVGHDVVHASHIGWDTLKDSDLIHAAEQASFAKLVTTDKKLYVEQKISSRQIGVAVLSSSRTKLIEAAHQRIRIAVEATTPGSYTYIDLQAGA